MARTISVPVDAMVEFRSEIDLSLVSLSGVMQQLDRGSRTNIVFLDACRDNPFAKQPDALNGQPLGGSAEQGPRPYPVGLGHLHRLRHAAGRGGRRRQRAQLAFTTALLDHIATPGQSISDMMIEVRNEVIASTNGAQVPWDSSSLTGRFAFVPAAAPVATAEPAAQVRTDN